MATKNWVIDPNHSEVQFKIRHLMITTVTGSFNLFEASVETEEEDFMTAMQEYKKASGRMFPTWSEVLEVLRDLGYEKIAPV